jgi:molybdate transport system permease protein
MNSCLTPSETDALILSVKTAAAATLLNGIPAIITGWFMARKRFYGRALAEGLLLLPMILPPVTTGYLLLLLFGRKGPLGSWLFDLAGIRLPFTWEGAVLASMIVSFPLFVRSVRLAVEMCDPGLEAASRVLGRGPVGTFFRVTIPLAFPGIMGGAVLCFARALGEFGATITFAGNMAGRTRTLPLAIHTALQTPGGDGASFRLTLLSVALALAALLVSELMIRRFPAGRLAVS